VGGERGQQPEQRLREAEPVADPVEPARERRRREERDEERDEEERDCERGGNRLTSLPTSLPGTPWLVARILREGQLPVRLEIGHAHADEPERPRPVAQCSVEECAGELADRLRVVDARGDRGR